MPVGNELDSLFTSGFILVVFLLNGDDRKYTRRPGFVHKEYELVWNSQSVLKRVNLKETWHGPDVQGVKFVWGVVRVAKNPVPVLQFQSSLPSARGPGCLPPSESAPTAYRPFLPSCFTSVSLYSPVPLAFFPYPNLYQPRWLIPSLNWPKKKERQVMLIPGHLSALCGSRRDELVQRVLLCSSPDLGI